MAKLCVSDIRVLYLRELRSALRERNIVVNSILLPIFLYPGILWLAYTGISFVFGQTEGMQARIVLEGVPAEHNLLKIDLERDPRVALRSSSDPAAEIRSGALDLRVEIVPPPGDAAALQGNFGARLTYDESKDRSRVARDRVAERIAAYRERWLESRAGQLGISPREFQDFWMDARNIATGQQMGRFVLGLMLPLFLIIMLAAGSMHPAIDATAGEREKSTWETLMTAATGRGNIVVAKYLYVATMASLAGILNLAAMLFSMKSILAPLLGDRLAGLQFQIPLGSVPLIMLVTVLLALFVAAGMMILASFARTFKEGQSMVTPFYLLLFLPAMFLQVPGLEFTPRLALIPIVNVTMVFREAIAGTYHWDLIGITIAVEIACIAAALKLAATILRYEDFVLGSYGGNFGKFVKQRLAARRPRTAA